MAGPRAPRPLSRAGAVLLLLTLPRSAADVAGVTAWGYQLQNISIEAIAANPTFQLIVIDYSSDGGEAGEWSPQQIESIRQSGKIPVAYISIGEAEDYRYYWNPAWEQDPPSWLGPENPDWPGNYKVRFWDPAWQAIIFAWIERIAAQGFGGLYLDIIDAYYFWSEELPENPQADADMAQFVLGIRAHLSSAGGPDALVIPQNGSFITVEDDVEGPLAEAYYAAIDAIGVEDVFYSGPADENNPYNPDAERLQMLAEYRAREKTVFSIEYLTEPALINQYIGVAAAETFLPYASVRALDQLFDGLGTGDVSPEPVGGEYRVLSLRPNPSLGPVEIPVHIAPEAAALDYGALQAAPLELRLYAADGRLVDRVRQTALAGWNRLEWRGAALAAAAGGAHGSVFYEVRVGGRPLGSGRFLYLP